MTLMPKSSFISRIPNANDPTSPFNIFRTVFGPFLQTAIVISTGSVGVFQLMKTFLLPSMTGPIMGEVTQAVTEGVLGALAPIPITPRFPSILGNVPGLGFLPRWLLPFVDAAMIGGIVVASPIANASIIGIGAKAAGSYIITSLKLGWGATAILHAAHAVLLDKFNVAKLAKATQTAIADPGVVTALPVWFEALDPALRVIIQGGFYATVTLITLKMAGRTPFGSPPKYIAPPDPKDIIIEQARERMGNFDNGLMLLSQFGIPAIGLVLVLTIIHKFYSLQLSVNAQTETNNALIKSLAAKSKADQSRNSSGQFASETPTEAKKSKVVKSEK